jgi:hypothetical protein
MSISLSSNSSTRAVAAAVLYGVLAGQSTIIIPSHDLVVVRLGHYKGDEAGSRDLNKSLALLMEAVPPHR